jgi:hypothetical protein
MYTVLIVIHMKPHSLCRAQITEGIMTMIINTHNERASQHRAILGQD